MWAGCCKKVRLVYVCVGGGLHDIWQTGVIIPLFYNIMKISGGNVPGAARTCAGNTPLCVLSLQTAPPPPCFWASVDFWKSF